MEDKEVKDKTVPDKAPEKNLKKPSGKSATGKPLDGIDVNPQLNDVSTDGNQLKIRKEDSVDLAAPVIQERKALTLPQRQQRARSIRSHERSMERAREVAKKKIAPTGKLQQRAVAHARAIVKKRFAARKGTPYAELTTTEKIQVDTAVAKKTKLIQKIAARLLPRIRKAEYERIKSFRNGEQLKDLSTQNPKAQGIMPAVKEEMSQLFSSLDGHDVTSLIGIIENAIDQFKQNNDPLGDQLKKMLNAVLPEDVVTESLLKKSDKTGIAFSTLKEVFERGEYDWDSSNRMTQEQYAFARVNSYIGKGKAWHMDADLREDKIVNEELDESFASFLEAKMKGKDPCWKGYEMVGTKKKGSKTVPNCVPEETHINEMDISKFNIRIAKPKQKTTPSRTFSNVLDEVDVPAKHLDRARNVWNKTKDVDAVKKFIASVKEETQATKIRKKIELVDRKPPHNELAKQQEIQKKIIDEAKATPYVKPYHEDGKQVGWKSSNGHHVKYWRLSDSAKKKAHEHAGINEETSLDESFNMAWTSGIGVTLSAADCGIKIKGGFELHPDVVEQMINTEFDEEVRSADVKGEIVAASKQTRTDPKTGKEIIVNIPAHVARGKMRRKIIGSGDVHNGETE